MHETIKVKVDSNEGKQVIIWIDGESSKIFIMKHGDKLILEAHNH